MKSALLRAQIEASLSHRIPSALTSKKRVAPSMFLHGIAELDAVTGGVPRGALTEICEAASSGRTSVLFSLIAEVARRQEVCALVDANDCFDPTAAAAAGIDLRRLLWVRCGKPGANQDRTAQDRASQKRASQERFRLASQKSAGGFFEKQNFGKQNFMGQNFMGQDFLEQALKVTDLLLQSGGFGLIAVDLGDISPQSARRVPLTSWFRFRRAVEGTPTALVVLEREPNAKTCASLVLHLEREKVRWSRAASGTGANSPALLRDMQLRVAILRSMPLHSMAPGSLQRGPQKATTFESRPAWQRFMQSNHNQSPGLAGDCNATAGSDRKREETAEVA